MTSVGPRVSGGCDYGNSLTDCLLSSLVHKAPRTGNILVSTQGYVEHANVVTITICDYPLNALCNVFFSYATTFTYFYQHDFRLVGQPAINALAELSITGSRNRRLRPVPLPGLDWLSRKRSALFEIFISYDAVHRCYEIGMRIESRIQKRHRHAFARIFQACLQSDGSGYYAKSVGTVLMIVVRRAHSCPADKPLLSDSCRQCAIDPYTLFLVVVGEAAANSF